MREKAEQGHYPIFAPLGYQNNRETKRIASDPEVAALIRKLFEWYATGNYSLLQVRNIARELMETQGLGLSICEAINQYYHCTSNHGPCLKPAVRQETLEEKLGEVIKGINIDEGLLDWLTQVLRENHRDKRAYPGGIISSLQTQYNRLQHRIDQANTDILHPVKT
jgi:hypothetical protein